MKEIIFTPFKHNFKGIKQKFISPLSERKRKWIGFKYKHDSLKIEWRAYESKLIFKLLESRYYLLSGIIMAY